MKILNILLLSSIKDKNGVLFSFYDNHKVIIYLPSDTSL